jgi:chromosome partitioning protein
MKTVTFAAQKGGSYKTNCSASVGCLLSSKYKILMVDLDPQKNLTEFFIGENVELNNLTMTGLVKNESTIQDCIRKISDNLSIIPSDMHFRDVCAWPSPAKEISLQRRLKEVKEDFDLVIVDCPGSLSTQTYIGMAAANLIIVPVKLEKMDIRTVTFTLHEIYENIRDIINMNLEGVAVLPVGDNYVNRTVNSVALKKLKDKFGELVLPFSIPSKSVISQFMYLGYDKADTKEIKKYYLKLTEFIEGVL